MAVKVSARPSLVKSDQETLSNKAGVTKPKKTKSRNGCLTCKRKRLKCDETKPVCLTCKNKKIECGGYATNFKWMSFNESSSTPDESKQIDSSPDKQIEKAGVLPSKSFREHLELASISMTGKSIKDIKKENDLISRGYNPESYKKVKVEESNRSVSRRYSDETLKSAKSKHSMRRSFSTNSPIPSDLLSLRSDYSQSNHNLQSLAEAAVDEMNRPPTSLHELKSQASTPSQIPFSPNFSDYLENKPAEITKTKELELHTDIQLTPSLSALINFAFQGDDNRDANFDPDSFKLYGEFPPSPLTLGSIGPLDENLRQSARSPSSLKTSNASSSTAKDSPDKIKLLSSSASPIDSISTPLSMIFDSESNRSLLKTSDQEQILHLYSSYTCTIMSIKNGANENPWRNMIIPLATKYPCLFNSIASMTLFHLAGNSDLTNTSADLRAKGYVYMKRCIVELATGLSRSGETDIASELPADIALATCLNLAVGESWDTQISSGIAHLMGARSMIQKVLTLLRDQHNYLSKKRKEWSSSGGDQGDYIKCVTSRKKDLQKKLVLLDNSEWERMLKDSEATQVDDTKDNHQGIIVPRSLQFLFNIWIYFEVLAQMTTDTNNDDKGIDLVATITTMSQNSRNKRDQERKIRSVDSDTASIPEATSPSAHSESSASSVGENGSGFNFFDNFDSFNYNAEFVDPLLGCGQSLFSLMGKVATLIANIRKKTKSDQQARNSLSTITRAAELKQKLIEWKPTITPSMIKQANSGGMCEDRPSGTWDISSCIATAEAYRFATLLYLHQAVPEIPSLSSHQLAEKIFILLASIPTTSHLYVIHIFPLLVGSCEADPGEEREWCETRWALLAERMWIGNIDRALEVVREVWKRKDEYIRKKRRSESEHVDVKFKVKNGESDDGRLRNISTQISGLMAVVNNNSTSSVEDIMGGITSVLHWSTVMKEWGWEVLLG